MPRKYIPVAQRQAQGTLPPSPKSKAAQTAQNIRWALVEANKTTIVDYIQALPTSESLPLLQSMRENVDAAAKAIQAKIDAQRQGRHVCVYCGGGSKGRGWRMETCRTNSVTRQLEEIKVCSDLCLAMWIQKDKGGIAALPDRGGKFGPDKPLRDAMKPPNGEASDARSEPVRETSN